MRKGDEGREGRARVQVKQDNSGGGYVAASRLVMLTKSKSKCNGVKKKTGFKKKNQIWKKKESRATVNGPIQHLRSTTGEGEAKGKRRLSKKNWKGRTSGQNQPTIGDKTLLGKGEELNDEGIVRK